VISSTAARNNRAVLFEDLHWVDPTTLELLDLLIDQVRTIRLSRAHTSAGFQSLALQPCHWLDLWLTRAQSSAVVSRDREQALPRPARKS
jgi:hypothetical protein